MGRISGQIPNFITSVRIALAFVFPFVSENARLPILISALSTEFLDGFIARRFGWTSRLGQILDPVADKLFFLSVALTFFFENKITAWELAATGARDIIVAIGAVALFLRRNWAEFEKMAPTFFGKLTTTLQYIVLFVLAWKLQLSPVLVSLVLMSGLIAAAQYIERATRS
ncbi:MAG: hypothetical protein A2X94_10155 [Bdellovibrionales bacterium GWB1_55_8]|nr:MAG: hypothetical protein A2X94_10155 [Bdellovibrionales bacterium GWB1_55_8]